MNLGGLIKKYLGIAIILVIAFLAGGFALLKFQEQQKDKELLNQRIAEILAERDSLAGEKESLLQQLDEFLTVEEVKLDSETIEEEIKEIGELATVSYCYTNAGTLDVTKNLFNTKIRLPGGTKTAVVTMDGTIKAGIEVSGLSLNVDEDKKIITVTIPDAKILSHEMDENSMQIYNETSGVFNKITLDDSSKIRKEIKAKAEAKATSSDIDILKQAKQNAQMVIRNFLSTDPTIKENYKIQFK